MINERMAGLFTPNPHIVKFLGSVYNQGNKMTFQFEDNDSAENFDGERDTEYYVNG
jgi:hypothetical protein